MEEVTLNMILAEFSRLSINMNTRFDRIDMEFKKVRSEMTVGFVKVNEEFKEVRKDLKAIFNQTAHLTERVTLLEEGKD